VTTVMLKRHILSIDAIVIGVFHCTHNGIFCYYLLCRQGRSQSAVQAAAVYGYNESAAAWPAGAGAPAARAARRRRAPAALPLADQLARSNVDPLSPPRAAPSRSTSRDGSFVLHHRGRRPREAAGAELLPARGRRADGRNRSATAPVSRSAAHHGRGDDELGPCCCAPSSRPRPSSTQPDTIVFYNRGVFCAARVRRCSRPRALEARALSSSPVGTPLPANYWSLSTGSPSAVTECSDRRPSRARAGSIVRP